MRFHAAEASATAYLNKALGLSSKEGAETFTITNQGTGIGYTVVNSAGQFLSLANGQVSTGSKAASFALFAVTL